MDQSHLGFSLRGLIVYVDRNRGCRKGGTRQLKQVKLRWYWYSSGAIIATMDLAMKFNETGVLLYRMGRGEDAFDLFSGAMQAMLHSCGGKSKAELDHFARQLLMVDPSVQRAFDKASLAAPAVRFDKRDLTLENPNDISESGKQNVQLPCSYPLGPFIFSQVASLNEMPKLQCRKNIKYAIAMSTTFYNEALLLHLGQVPTSRKCLERALTFYSMAGNALLQNCPSDFIASHKLSSRLYSGILNNKGIILHEMGDFDASRFCFAYLNQFLGMLAAPATEAEKRERKEFALNCLLFDQSFFTASAA